MNVNCKSGKWRVQQTRFFFQGASIKVLYKAISRFEGKGWPFDAFDDKEILEIFGGWLPIINSVKSYSFKLLYKSILKFSVLLDWQTSLKGNSNNYAIKNITGSSLIKLITDLVFIILQLNSRILFVYQIARAQLQL